MLTNKQIRRILQLYAELLRVHEMEEKWAGALSSAAYYIRRVKENIITLDRQEIKKLFKPQIGQVLIELQAKSTIEALDELIRISREAQIPAELLRKQPWYLRRSLATGMSR